MRLPVVVLALGISSAVGAQEASPPMVLGVLNGWGIVRPMAALTESEWVGLDTASDFETVLSPSTDRTVFAKDEDGARTWRLIPDDGTAHRNVRTGPTVVFDDQYFVPWGLLSDQPPVGIGPDVAPPFLGLVVPTTVEARSSLKVDDEDPLRTAVDQALAPFVLSHLYRIPVNEGQDWLFFEASRPLDGDCAVEWMEGWTREGEIGVLYRERSQESDCERKSWGARTPIGVVKTEETDIVVFLESEWESLGLALTSLSDSSVGEMVRPSR